VWQNSNTWEQHYQIKIACRKILRADYVRGMPATIRSSRLLSRNVKVKIYKTMILPVVLYCCETWSLTLKMEELHIFNSSPNIIRQIK
jgi:hypothetical protein